MAAGKLDAEAFPPFLELLEACQDYAELSGSRFLHRDFAKEALALPAGATPSKLQEAVRKALPAVQQFRQRVLSKDEALKECIERAHRFVMTEAVRAGIVATCQEVGLWPPRLSAAVAEDDCCYQDTTAPLPVIAQRAFNDEARRKLDELLHPLVRRATTASFLIDFVTEAGLPPPTLTEQCHEMLEEFMARVEEWMAANANDDQVIKGASRVAMAREALLEGLSYGGATAEAARQQVMTRWSKNWETPSGTLMNVAAAGLAIVAGLAAMKRASKR